MKMTRLIAFALISASSHVAAEGALRATSAWIRSAPPGVAMFAGYADITNSGDQPIRMVAVRSERFADIELHRTVVEQGVSRMRPAGTQELAPGATLRLRPGELHLMLMRPEHDVREGETIEINFFDDASSAHPVLFTVRRDAPPQSP